jgi:hypothetical protein
VITVLVLVYLLLIGFGPNFLASLIPTIAAPEHFSFGIITMQLLFRPITQESAAGSGRSLQKAASAYGWAAIACRFTWSRCPCLHLLYSEQASRAQANGVSWLNWRTGARRVLWGRPKLNRWLLFAWLQSAASIGAYQALSSAWR